MASGQPATAAPSQSPVIRTTKLASVISSSAATLVDRFTDILDIAGPGNKDKYITAAETYQIDVHASAMVRAAEDLLTLTRKLRQLWILSEAREENGERRAEIERRLQVGDVAKELQRILRNKESVEEMDDIQQGNNSG